MAPPRSRRSASSFSSTSRRAFEAPSFSLAQRLALDLQLHPAPLHLVQLGGHRVDLHPQLRGRLVDQVDRLVGQEAVADVAVREDRPAATSAESLIRTPWCTSYRSRRPRRMLIVSSTDGWSTSTGWNRRSSAASFSMCLRYSSRVVAPMQCSSAAGQHRLQHVARVHRALGLAGADDRVQLVDEQDDLPLGVLHFLQHGLEALLKLAAELGAGDQRAHVQRAKTVLSFRPSGTSPRTIRWARLDDRRLAHARLADEHRVVLGLAAEHLDDAPDLGVPADDRVQLAVLARSIGSGPGRTFRGLLVRRLGVRARHRAGCPEWW